MGVHKVVEKGHVFGFPFLFRSELSCCNLVAEMGKWTEVK